MTKTKGGVGIGLLALLGEKHISTERLRRLQLNSSTMFTPVHLTVAGIVLMVRNSPDSKNFLIGAQLLGAFVLVVAALCVVFAHVSCRQTAPQPQTLEAPEQTSGSEAETSLGVAPASVGVAITEETGDPSGETGAGIARPPHSAAETNPDNVAPYNFVGPAQSRFSSEPSHDDPMQYPGQVRIFSAPALPPGSDEQDADVVAVASGGAPFAADSAPSAPPADAGDGIAAPSRDEEYVPPPPASYEVRFLTSN